MAINENIKAAKFTQRLIALISLTAMVVALSSDDGPMHAREDIHRLSDKAGDSAAGWGLDATWSESDVGIPFRQKLLEALGRVQVSVKDSVFVFPSLPTWISVETEWSSLQQLLLARHLADDILVFLPSDEDLDAFAQAMRRRLESERWVVTKLSLDAAVVHDASLRGRITDVQVEVELEGVPKTIDRFVVPIRGELLGSDPQASRSDHLDNRHRRHS